MMGAGAVAGSLSGGNTSAARSSAAVPVVITTDRHPVDITPARERVSSHKAVHKTARLVSSDRPTPDVRPAPSAKAIVANRFPPGWQTASATAAPVPAAPAVMAYAAESQPAGEHQPAAPSSGYQLASVDPGNMPKRVERPAQPKHQVLFNDAQLASIKARLRLSPDQERHWPQVEQALRAISWRLATQQSGKRAVRGSRAATIDPNSPEVARLKSAAIPLIMSMRADQKEQVRQLAHTMGLSQVASMF
jgi:hypothetical protein